MDQPKQYEATVKLGATTETDDIESPEIEWPNFKKTSPPRLEHIQSTLRTFTGQILQSPPAYSALHVQGRRAYDLARSGIEVKLPPRPVSIYAIEMLSYCFPELKLRIDCGRGTYIRALARDIGRSLDTGGYLSSLKRTRVGDFWISTAARLDDLTSASLSQKLIVPAPPAS